MNRNTIFAGTWYPTTINAIKQFTDPSAQPATAIGAVCPHAGWVYSGATAGAVFSRLAPAKTYIIIGPNHTGRGTPLSLYAKGAWETPLGALPIDEPLAKALLTMDTDITADFEAHEQEHSIEVQLPFIKYFSPAAAIVPIAMADYRPAVCERLGTAIATVLRAQHKETSTLIIASSDMSHYLSVTEAQAADKPAIDRILKRDPTGLLHVVTKDAITMCGAGPVAVMLHAATALGAQNATLVKYAHSGEETGDTDQVVTYAGIIVS